MLLVITVVTLLGNGDILKSEWWMLGGRYRSVILSSEERVAWYFLVLHLYSKKAKRTGRLCMNGGNNRRARVPARMTAKLHALERRIHLNLRALFGHDPIHVP